MICALLQLQRKYYVMVEVTEHNEVKNSCPFFEVLSGYAILARFMLGTLYANSCLIL